MPAHTITDRLRSRGWNANKRTLPRSRRCSEALLDEAEQLRDAGKFEAGIELFSSIDPDALADDPVALNGFGHCLLGGGRHEEALEAFRRAANAAATHQAKALINEANALKLLNRFDRALAAAEAARVLRPNWFVPYLMLIAIYECRAGDGDREAAREIGRDLTSNCPDWRENVELRRYVHSDVDYARFREDEAFSEIFENRFSRS